MKLLSKKSMKKIFVEHTLPALTGKKRGARLSCCGKVSCCGR